MEGKEFIMPGGEIISADVADEWRTHTGVPLPQQQGAPRAEQLDDFPTDGAMTANTDPAANARAAVALRRVAIGGTFGQ